jgi:amino acid permease
MKMNFGVILLLLLAISSASNVFITNSKLLTNEKKLKIRDVQAKGINVISSKRSTNHKEHTGMSTFTLGLNIIADLTPHGMLPLAFGLATGGTTGTVIAAALVVFFAFLSSTTMVIFAKLAKQTNSSSITEVVEKIYGKSFLTTKVVDILLILLCAGCCLFYACFVGDIFHSIATATGVAEKLGYLGSRSFILSAISLCVLLPLCLLENLAALQFSSFLGVAGVLFTVLYHAKCLVHGTYSPTSSMTLGLEKKYRPIWPKEKFPLFKFDFHSLVLVNLLCVAFLAHYNSISYYKELENTSIEKYQNVIRSGYLIVGAIFLGMMFMGYTIFGSSSQPLILNNFHQTKDILATMARLATGSAIVFAFPLMFSPLKASLFNLLFPKIEAIEMEEEFVTLSPPNINMNLPSIVRKVLRFLILFFPNIAKNTIMKTKKIMKPKKIIKPSSHDSEVARKAIVFSVLTIITALACQMTEESVSFVLGIVGSVLGCGVAFILPAILKMKSLKSTQEMLFNSVILFVGIGAATLGCYVTFKG